MKKHRAISVTTLPALVGKRLTAQGIGQGMSKAGITFASKQKRPRRNNAEGADKKHSHTNL